VLIVLEIIRRNAMSVAARSLSVLAAGTLLVAISGCNTMEGVGEDMEDAGDKIQEEAEEHND
jgi:predicted small secreted protein